MPLALVTLFAPALTVLCHEAAHYVVAWLFRFPGLEFQAMAVRYDVVSHPDYQRFLVTAAGLVTTFGLVVLGVAIARRNLYIGIALAAAAPIRALVWPLILIAYLRGHREPITGDEATLAALTGIPLPVWIGASIGLLNFSIWWIAGEIRRQIHPYRGRIWFLLIASLFQGYLGLVVISRGT